MEAEDGGVEVRRLGENSGEDRARSEPSGKQYGFSGYLLENPTVLQGRRNWVWISGDFGAPRGSRRDPRRSMAATPHFGSRSSCGFAQHALPGQ